MRSISSSIVALAGAVILSAGAFVAHNQTQSFLMLVGAGVGLLGLVAWLKDLGREN